MLTTEELLSDILARVAAMEKPALDETALRANVKSLLDEFMGDPEFTRKMKFAQPEPALIGSKFARWGLSLGDIEWLYDTMSATAKGPSEDLRKAFEAISDAVYMPQEEIRRIDKVAIDNMFPRITKRNQAEYERVLRAMDTAESGYGSQLVGAQYVGELWAQARNDARILPLLGSFEMNAPTAYLPVEVDFPEMTWVAENTSATASAYTTVKTGSNRVTVTAYKFIISQVWSGEMEEESIIPFIPFLRAQAAKSLSFYGDSVVMNGDTTNAGSGNINLYDADPADTKHYLALDGIRHAASVDNTNNFKNAAGAITLSLLRGSKGRMLDSTYKADWGHPNSPNDLVYVADPETADQIATLDEVISYKIQAGMPLLTGEVARVLGHPVLSSIAMSKTLTSGFVSTTAGSNTYGQVCAFNRNAFKVGWRRRVKVEVENLPGRDQTMLFYSLRMGLGRFSPTGAASGIEAADVIYNISL